MTWKVHFPLLDNYAIMSLSNRTLGWVVYDIFRIAFQKHLTNKLFLQVAGKT